MSLQAAAMRLRGMRRVVSFSVALKSPHRYHPSSTRFSSVQQQQQRQRGLSHAAITRQEYPSPFEDVDIPASDNLYSFLSASWSNNEVASRKAFVHAEDGTSYTFAQLHEHVEGTASGLAAAGFEPGDTLALHMQNHPDFFAAFLAAIKLGGRVTTSNPVYV